MHFHHFHQVHKRFTADDTVGIATNKVAVAAAPGVEKIADVTALAGFVDEAAAIINFAERIEFADQIIPTAFFLDPFVRVGRIAQDEKVEAFELTGFFE